MASSSGPHTSSENLFDVPIVVDFDEPPNPKRRFISTTATLHERGNTFVNRKNTHNNPYYDGWSAPVGHLIAIPVALDESIRTMYLTTDYINHVEYSNMGIPSMTCPFCGASYWRDEAIKSTAMRTIPEFNRCCKKGLIKLHPPIPIPPYLSSLLQRSSNSTHTNFMDNIRVYNSMFSFTSIGARVDSSINKNKGPFIFKISGQNHHLMGSLLPPPNESPKFAQLYIFDTANETENRLSHFNSQNTNPTLDPSIVAGLIKMMDEHNILAKSFRMARDRLQGQDIPQLKLRLLGRRQLDSKQYEPPTANEIASLIVGGFEHYDMSRDLIIETSEKALKHIHILHPSLMALQYPLLFPYGEDGYTENIPYSPSPLQKSLKRKHITMREYYAFQLYSTSTQTTSLHLYGRLFQQYIVDAYSCVEQARLDFLRRNQTSLRSEIYSGLRDAFFQGDRDGAQIGKKIILPSTYTGGPRYMLEHYQDAMTICRFYGNPHFFITFTCNPMWPEIRETLSTTSDTKGENRPDIVARVFKMKIESLMCDLKKKEIFGKTSALLYTVEFQKRGLPHVHCLVWLQRDRQRMTPSEINNFITAELPDPKHDPIGFNAVTRYMIHGPCGPVNKKSPCMKNGKCSKFFPKQQEASTKIDEHGFVTYKRSLNSFSYEKNGLLIDNRFVVPHNRNLIVRYQAHLNIEACCYSTMVKYLFKYITKGNDRARVVVQEENAIEMSANDNSVPVKDEIKEYLDCRYISPPKACWRLFEFPIHHREPSVDRLPVHLPFQNVVLYHEQRSLNSVVNYSGAHKTMLTEWMSTNVNHIEARSLTYVQFPMHWLWDSKEKRWFPRKKGSALGRISYVHPRSGELYYLRMLLNFVKGVKTFEDIRTLRGVVHTTFQSVCEAYGLLGNDNEWHAALKEASFTGSAKQLRQLFVVIVIFCGVADPVKLFDTFYSNFTEDIEYEIRHRFGLPLNFNTSVHIKNYVLKNLEMYFNRNGCSLIDFHLPMPSSTSDGSFHNRLLQEEQSYDIVDLHSKHVTMFATLNAEQLDFYNTVFNSLGTDGPQTFFLYGHGGTGKTYLYETIISRLRSECKIVLVVASSGISALLLPGGRTAHSRFKIPLDVTSVSTCNIKKGTDLAKLIEESSLIVWDEAPMCHRFCFEALDRSMRDILSDTVPGAADIPFGKKPVILGGDFRQILPVIPNGSKEDILDASLTNSYLWPHFKVCALKANMRLTETHGSFTHDEYDSFSQWLLAIGNGTVHGCMNEVVDADANWITLPSQLIPPPSSNPISTIVSKTYPELLKNYKNPSYLQERAIVTPRNETAKQINEYILNLIPDMQRTYYSNDSICKTTANLEEFEALYPVEFLNSINPYGIPSHEVLLKLNTPVMLLRNINPSIGLCNGTRLVILQLGDRVIEASILTGSFVGNRVFIPRIMLNYIDKKLPFTLQRRQFPVKICYSMTINKSQGQTLKQVGLFLNEPVFTHGQLYVALSRVTNSSNITITVGNETMEENSIVNPNDHESLTYLTKNVVYTEIFESL